MALSRGEILVDPVIEDNGTGASLTFRDTTATPETVVLNVPSTVTTSYTITLPADTNGTGWSGYVLSFAESGGTVTSSFEPITVTPGGTVDGAVQYRSGTSTVGSDGVLVGATTLTLPNGSEARFDDTGSNYLAFTGPGVAMTGPVNNTYTLPFEIGSAGQVLKLANVVGSPATSADLIWDNALTGSATAQGNQGTVQLSDGAAGFASAGSGTPYDEDLTYGVVGGTYATANKVLNIANSSGQYRINDVEYLTSSQVGPSTGTLALGAGVTTSSLTTVGTLTALTVDGNVSVNNTISTPVATDLVLNPGTGGVIDLPGNASGPSVVRLAEATGNGTNTMTIQAPNAIASNHTITLPAQPTTAVSGMGILSANNYTYSYYDTRKAVNFVIDGGGLGSAIQAGPKGSVYIPTAHVLEEIRLFTGFTVSGGNDTFDVIITQEAGTTAYPSGSPTAVQTISMNNSRYAIAPALNISIPAGNVLNFTVSGTPTQAVITTVSLTLRPVALT